MPVAQVCIAQEYKSNNPFVFLEIFLSFQKKIPTLKGKIPIRSMPAKEGESSVSENFRIRTIRELAGGKDMIQELHRHDFFFVLVLEKGSGAHEIDFTSYEVSNHSVFFLRPGQ